MLHVLGDAIAKGSNRAVTRLFLPVRVLVSNLKINPVIERPPKEKELSTSTALYSTVDQAPPDCIVSSVSALPWRSWLVRHRRRKVGTEDALDPLVLLAREEFC